MKRRLDAQDITAAILGGTILGGGGGGIPASAERTARLAADIGVPELWSSDEFDSEDLTATVALVGAPAAPNPFVTPRHHLRSMELLRTPMQGSRALAAINTNENGAETTINGWIQSALTGLPVIDLACNGRAHPTSQMGALGLHASTDYVSYQAFSGGAPERYVEGLTSGRIDMASGVVRRASIEAGGMVTVVRNPVSVGYAVKNGAPGAISFAIELGNAWIDGGLDGAARWLNARVVAEGTVKTYQCEQREGLDVGLMQLDDSGSTTLRFINEYMVVEQGKRRTSTFPDLIMTFTDEGNPVVSAHVRKGMRVKVLHAPAARLVLSRTMHMPELYRPLEDILGMAFAPDLAPAI